MNEHYNNARATQRGKEQARPLARERPLLFPFLERTAVTLRFTHDPRASCIRCRAAQMPRRAQSGVSPLGLLLSAAIASAAGPAELLFNFTRVRYNSYTTALQISELKLYDAAGALIDTVNATNAEGHSPVPWQGAAMSNDGQVTTKWIDVTYGDSGYSLLYLTPVGSVVIASCAQLAATSFFFAARSGC